MKKQIFDEKELVGKTIKKVELLDSRLNELLYLEFDDSCYVVESMADGYDCDDAMLRHTRIEELNYQDKYELGLITKDEYELAFLKDQKEKDLLLDDHKQEFYESIKIKWGEKFKDELLTESAFLKRVKDETNNQ